MSFKNLSQYKFCQVASLLNHTTPKNNLRIQGWVVKEHRKGKLSFLHVNDGLSSKSVQVVLPKEVGKGIGIGSAVEIGGNWVASNGRQQAWELFADELRIWAKDIGPPVNGTFDQIRQNLHLRTRHPTFAALTRLRSNVAQLSHEFFGQHNFTLVDTPLITANDCEGAGETFSVGQKDAPDFFGEGEQYLTVSGQLHLEAAASGLSRVYTLSNAFRAEKSLSRQHLAEFKMLEAEVGFCDNLDDLCNLVEGYIRFLASRICESSDFAITKDSEHFSKEPSLVDLCSSTTSFPRLKYEEAIRILESQGQTASEGLGKHHERFLVEHLKSPVFVTHFPASQKPFYMKRSIDGTTAECFDLLSPLVGELAGGSLREDDASKLRSSFHGSDLDWYIELRTRGAPASGGFGIGFERLIQSLFGVVNIKDAATFPRWYKHCSC